jgi:hypothetical protein
MSVSVTTRNNRPQDPLAALRRDPAVRAAERSARAWLLALLQRGERATRAAEK